jgi:tetratricopeptide (TPR) repeat protein
VSGREAPEDLLRAAAAHRQAGRVPEAIEAYRRLLKLRPNLPDTWYNLGLMLRRAGQPDAALAAYGQALVRGVKQPEEVRLNRAVILADDLRRDEDAHAELTAALTLNPTYVPALLNLGNLHEDNGRRADAADAYRKALAADPRNATALARLSGLEQIDSPAHPLVDRLKKALSRPGLAPADAAELGFALGSALDRAAAHDEAFAAYTAANSASRKSAPSPPLYDRAAHEALIDEIIAAFPEPVPASEGAEAPIFICGMFRSGSTLAEQILACHPRVTSGGELDLLPAMVRRDLSPFPAAAADLDDQRAARLTKDYRARLAAIFPHADRLTDKRPDNFLYVGLIKRLFSAARIVHTRRAALDNCLSVFFLHLDHAMSYAFELADIAHYLLQQERLMAHWKSLYPGDIHELDYDGLVQDPRPAIEDLLQFCGLDWNDACLSPQNAGGSVKTASVWQVRQPLYRGSSGRWRNYQRQLKSLALLPDQAADMERPRTSGAASAPGL